MRFQKAACSTKKSFYGNPAKLFENYCSKIIEVSKIPEGKMAVPTLKYKGERHDIQRGSPALPPRGPSWKN